MTEIFFSDVFPINVVSYAAKVICITFKIQRPIICDMMVESYRDVITFVKYNTKLTPEEICGVLIGDFCIRELTENVFWYLNLTNNMGTIPFRRGGKKIIIPARKFEKTSKITKFVQITDIHPDPKYAPGTNLFCGDPICCRRENGFPVDKKSAAGSWAGYLCDPPLNITSDALRQIYSTHPDASFWLWTGDNVHHEPYNTTKDDVKFLLKQTTDQFLPYLRTGLKIYPSLGNHDVVPLNG